MSLTWTSRLQNHCCGFQNNRKLNPLPPKQDSDVIVAEYVFILPGTYLISHLDFRHRAISRLPHLLAYSYLFGVVASLLKAGQRCQTGRLWFEWIVVPAYPGLELRHRAISRLPDLLDYLPFFCVSFVYTVLSRYINRLWALLAKKKAMQIIHGAWNKIAVALKVTRNDHSSMNETMNHNHTLMTKTSL